MEGWGEFGRDGCCGGVAGCGEVVGVGGGEAWGWRGRGGEFIQAHIKKSIKILQLLFLLLLFV